MAETCSLLESVAHASGGSCVGFKFFITYRVFIARNSHEGGAQE